MELKQRYLLVGDCFLNNRYVEKGAVIMWPPSLANAAMVPCDARGRPKGRQEEKAEIEDVHVVEVEAPEPKPQLVELTDQMRTDKVVQAVRDVLEEDDDAHYTASGQIRLQVIRQLSGVEDVSRAEVDEAEKLIKESEQEATETDAAKAKAKARGGDETDE